MDNLKIGDFVWAKMTGYPYWPGKIVEPDKDVKKPNKKSEMLFVRFYGTGDFAWTKVDMIHKFEENREKYSNGSKRVMFVDAVKKIEHAVENREKGLPDTSDESDAGSEASDDLPLAVKAKNGRRNSIEDDSAPLPKKRRKSTKKSLPTREEVKLVKRLLECLKQFVT